MARWAVADEAFTEQFTAWRTAQDPAAREAILLHYFPLCEVVAQGIARRMPPHVDRGELTSLAVLGLFRAVDNYDPAVGSSFWKYAVMCMRSVVLDGVRAEDWAPRSLRKRQRDLEKAESELEKSLHRQATDAEVALRTGWTVTQIRNTRQEIAASWHAHLEETGIDEPSTAVSDQTEHLETEHLREAAASAIEGMTGFAQAVVVLRYYEEMSFAEIALRMGVTKAEAEKAHNAAVGEVWARVREVAVV